MLDSVNVRAVVGGAAPWYGASASGSGCYGARYKTSDLHYRGWTLVDDRGWRWAVKDGTNRRVRICRDNTPTNRALTLFREIVDASEDGGGDG